MSRWLSTLLLLGFFVIAPKQVLAACTVTDINWAVLGGGSAASHCDTSTEAFALANTWDDGPETLQTCIGTYNEQSHTVAVIHFAGSKEYHVRMTSPIGCTSHYLSYTTFEVPPPDCPGGIYSDPATGACACEDGYAPDYDPVDPEFRNCDRPTPDCLFPFVDANGVSHCGINNQNFCDNNPTDPVCDHFTPDPDADSDGIPDATDTCPNDATNTCNDPLDADGDGIPDLSDNCPNDDTNTCNVVDTDSDGIPDAVDQCPTDAFDQCVADPAPEVDTHSPDDLDSDGIPNSQDPDIDNDGIVNTSDNDIDGDGVPNADDSDPYGDSSNDSAGASDSCTVKPECTGDVFNCAVLDQIWLDTCKVEHEAEELADLQNALNNYTPTDSEGQLLELDKGQIDVGVLAGDYLNQTGAGGSCPSDLSIPLSIGSVSLPYTFLCNFASSMSGLVVIIFGFISARIVYRGFVS